MKNIDSPNLKKLKRFVKQFCLNELSKTTQLSGINDVDFHDNISFPTSNKLVGGDDDDDDVTELAPIERDFQIMVSTVGATNRNGVVSAKHYGKCKL